MASNALWTAQPEWASERQCFIIGGGASVLSQDVGALRGQKIIAINSSYQTVPFADFVIFADNRWFLLHRKALTEFSGRIVSACTASAAPPPKLLRVRRTSPPGLSRDRGAVALKNTTLSGAINLAVHLFGHTGPKRIVLLGIDGKAINGRTHHHAPHPSHWGKSSWQKQRGDLVKISEQLQAQDIECVNASPDSAWDLWPKVRLDDYVSSPTRYAAEGCDSDRRVAIG